MALPVLDGNQSATTLSSVVTGGEHIVAHSVVSLGTTAISNINSAVSGSAVTIPGLARLSNSIASDGTADANLDFIKIGGHQDGQNQVAHIVHVSAGGAMKVDASGSSVTFSQAPVTFGAITGSASILNFPSTQTIAGTVTANVFGYNEGQLSYQPIPITWDANDSPYIPVGQNTDALANTLTTLRQESQTFPVSGTVTVGNSVTIGSLPTISGTVTVSNATTASAVFVKICGEQSGAGSNEAREIQTDDGGFLYVRLTDPSVPGSKAVIYDPVAGNSYVNVRQTASVTIGSLPTISGTVTVSSLPRPTWTDYSGSVATANSAVTAISTVTRSYLLAQVTTGQMFLNIGATCTTGNGVYFSAGQGFAWETSVPQGIVSIISSVTGTNYVLKDG